MMPRVIAELYASARKSGSRTRPAFASAKIGTMT
jgi:hypothetical protein